MLINTDLEEKETPVVESENKDNEETTSTQTAEDQAPDESEVDGEKEEEQEEVKDPYEERLKELQDKDRRKSAALRESKDKIDQLKKQLNEQGLDAEQIKSVVEDVIGSKLQSIEETHKKLDEALKIADESNIDVFLSKKSDNEGEKKIMRHFFDTEVNKSLPFEKQIEQAVILAKHAMSDEKFKQDVEKANQLSIGTSGKTRESADIPENIRNMAEVMFKTKEGKKEFYDEYRKKLTK